MKFRNKTDGIRFNPGFPFQVEPGDELEVAPDQAPGFVLQCGPDGAWEPADADAEAAVKAATEPAEAVAEAKPKPRAAAKTKE